MFYKLVHIFKSEYLCKPESVLNFRLQHKRITAEV